MQSIGSVLTILVSLYLKMFTGAESIQSQKITVYEGKNVTITCKDVNNSLPHFQWVTRDPENAVEFLCPALNVENGTSKSGNEDSLHLVNVSRQDEKDYYCIVGDGRKYEYQNFQLRVVPRPVTSEVKGKDNTSIYVGVSVGAFLIIMIVLIMIKVVLRYRRSNLKNDKGEKTQPENVSLPPLPAVPDTARETYIDPMIYVDIVDAVKEFANEIDPASLSLEHLIGTGEFGHVYKGKLAIQDGKTILVAAKTLKTNASEKSVQDFLFEASVMGQFDDPNVIHLEGVITQVPPKMIVIEFMINGSLDNFLKQNEGKFTAIQLMSMARGVASGMKYLAAMNFIHRDLAARNILVDENMVCKVADFGLSRGLENTDSSSGELREYISQGGKIPVRWTAPEAIKYRLFTTASDVWSFGILLWEIMSAAQRPYGDWDNLKVMVRVDNGFRLPSPVNCPQAVHELMLKCWNKEHGFRPPFEDIEKTIDEWIERPENLDEPSAYV